MEVLADADLKIIVKYANASDQHVSHNAVLIISQ